MSIYIPTYTKGCMQVQRAVGYIVLTKMILLCKQWACALIALLRLEGSRELLSVASK